MMHPHTQVRQVDDIVGVGVFATHDIPMGTVVWAKDPWDREIDPKRLHELPADLHPFLERYAYEEQGMLVLCWDHARFVNHNCEATNLGLDLGFEIVVRDVKAGEQLTDDYALLGLHEPMACACGSPRCRGVVHPDDRERLLPMWSAVYEPALARVASVEQPLGVRARAALDVALKRWPRAAAALG
jgi:hypothetical protein